MITFIRRFFDSKFGIPISLGFLALIAVAFASSDITGTGMFGGVSGGDRVAVVGDEKIGTADLSRAASNALDQARQQNPTLTMASFLRGETLNEVLDSVLDRNAIAQFAKLVGLRAGDNLLNSEILEIPAFRGPDGNFSDEIYRAAIGGQGPMRKCATIWARACWRSNCWCLRRSGRKCRTRWSASTPAC
jgi:peptidyl-prolyl cis-trans isomerase D